MNPCQLSTKANKQEKKIMKWSPNCPKETGVVMFACLVVLSLTAQEYSCLLSLQELSSFCVFVRCCWSLDIHPFIVNPICSFAEWALSSAQAVGRYFWTSTGSFLTFICCIKDMRTSVTLLCSTPPEGRSANLATHRHLQSILKPDSVSI